MTGRELTEEATIKNSVECCIIFPSTQAKIFTRILPSFLKKKIDLHYSFFAYENIDKKAVDFIRDICRNRCILVIAYRGKISLEHSYKLGIAHALNTCVILIDLEKEDSYTLPEYIKYKFMIYGVSLKEKEGLENLLNKTREVIVVYLSGNTIEILYQEAISICAALEENQSISIDKVEKNVFIQRLSNEDINICFNDYEASREILLERIILDEISLAQVYWVSGDFLNEIKRVSQMNDRGKKITWIGDRIDGDKVMGDKDTIAGNKMKTGDVAGDAIAGNKIVNTQDLAQAAKDINALINQLSTDYDTTTPSGKRKLTDRILETLEGNTTIQNRVLKALTGAGKVALEEAIDHPIAKVLVAGLEGYLE
jgi:hypothetical protein